ncbi:MAG: fumarate hydratase [Elusimicrobiota bacterium]|nr:fumarate hydratase [Elusimicrobiota bacterium]
MRVIKSDLISETVENLCAQANYDLPEDVLDSLKMSFNTAEKIPKEILGEIIENANIAKKERIPLCQDTGVANFFVNFGKNVSIEDGNIYDAINKGVASGYLNNYLRKSMVTDPFERVNSQDNTPANIYIEIVDGKNIEISFLPKGGGCENASAIEMFNPSSDWEDVKNFILSVVEKKGWNACPPLVIGIGIGTDFSSVGFLAKKSLIRTIGSHNQNQLYDNREKELLRCVNELNIGVMGFGGKDTALAVFIEPKPCHIASLPVAVNIQCHSYRRKTIVI